MHFSLLSVGHTEEYFSPVKIHYFMHYLVRFREEMVLSF